MGFYTFKTIDLGTIAAGNTVSSSWTSDDDYIIKRMYVVEYTSTAVGTRFLTGTFRVDGYTFTKDVVPLSLFDGYKNQVPQLDIDISKGKTFYYSVKNNHSSSSIAAYLVLELEKKP